MNQSKIDDLFRLFSGSIAEEKVNEFPRLMLTVLVPYSHHSEISNLLFNTITITKPFSIFSCDATRQSEISVLGPVPRTPEPSLSTSFYSPKNLH